MHPLRHIIEALWLGLYRPGSMIRWLTGMSLAVAVAILAFGTTILLSFRAEEWDRAKVASDNLVIALSRDIARNVALYDLSLQGVVQALTVPELARADTVVRRMALFDASSSADYLNNIIITDAHGEVTESSASSPPIPLNVAEREQFTVHLQQADAGLFISGPFEDRLVHDTMIALSRRIDNLDGSFGGIVSGTMGIGFFDDLFAKLDTGTHGTVTLFRADGTIIARRPAAPKEIGAGVSTDGIFQSSLKALHGHFVAISSLDGVRRLFTFHHIDSLPLILTVSVAVDDIYAAWWHKAISMGAVLSSLCVASVVLCLLFRRELLRRVKAEDALVQAAKRLSVMAATDGLTGIANRRAFEEALAREWRRAIRGGTALAVMMIDVDCFKLFNDHHGHQAGDDILRAIAASIAGNTRRPSDTVARYGGEEFIVLLPDTDWQGTINVAETIRAGVADLGIPHARGLNGKITVSIGLAIARPIAGDAAATLVGNADTALYEAKRSGRNRVVPGGDPDTRVSGVPVSELPIPAMAAGADAAGSGSGSVLLLPFPGGPCTFQASTG